MAGGKWKNPDPIIEVDYVEIKDDAQLQRWYASWYLLDEMMTKQEIKEAEAASTAAQESASAQREDPLSEEKQS